MNFRQLISWKGEITRRDYLILGLILFAIKYNLDRLTAVYFGRYWTFIDYFVQTDKLTVQELTAEDKTFYLVLLIQSLPFIWFGTVLCVKRLRSTKIPTWTVIFFFIPFVNFILFIILCTIPEKEKIAVNNGNPFLDKLIPTSKYGSAMFAMGIVLVISLMITGLLINYLKDYGWSLFVGIPFFLGFGSVLIYGYHHKRLLFREAMGVAFASIIVFCAIIFVLAFEGIICLVMGFPILTAISMIGAAVGYAVHGGQKTLTVNTFILPVMFIPLVAIIEHNSDVTPITTSVTSEIVVNASKQQVWNELVAFTEIEEPTKFLFKTGIAYPTHAQIEGTGVGAIRKCNFTTGPFIEPITTWDEPNVLAFGVLDQPPAMVEWSIYNDLQIPHLEAYFKSEKGQFKLESLPNGQTKLIGTTWYHHDIWPSFYWRWWSDYILHEIHLRVLNHIKTKAEIISNGK